MNTQMMLNGPAKPSPKEAPEPEKSQKSEKKGEDTPFGAALQTEVRRGAPKAKPLKGGAGKPRVGKGQWAATQALAKKSKAIGRTLRGLSDLAIERPKVQAGKPDLTELNAAGREFAGKVKEVVAERSQAGELVQAKAEVPERIAEARGRRDDAAAIQLPELPKEARPESPVKVDKPTAQKAEAPKAAVDDDGPKMQEISGEPVRDKADAKAVKVVARKTPQGGAQELEALDQGKTLRVTAEASAQREGAARLQTAGRVLNAAGSDAATRVARVTEQMAVMVREGTHRAQMELHPPDLGRVTLEVEVRGEQVAVKMVVESAEAHQRLRSDAEALAEALKDQGLDLTGMDVSVDRGDGGEGGDEEQAVGGAGEEGAFGALMGEGPPTDSTTAGATRRWHAGDVDLKA